MQSWKSFQVPVSSSISRILGVIKYGVLRRAHHAVGMQTSLVMNILQEAYPWKQDTASFHRHLHSWMFPFQLVCSL